jgi:hypothetical protein
MTATWRCTGSADGHAPMPRCASATTTEMQRVLQEEVPADTARPAAAILALAKRGIHAQPRATTRSIVGPRFDEVWRAA